MAGKLKNNDGAGSPSDPKSVKGFGSNFSSHLSYIKAGLASSACSDLTWMANLHAYQRDSLPVFRILMEPSLATVSLLQQSVEKDATIPAELALQQPRWKSLLDLDSLMEAKEWLSCTGEGVWGDCRLLCKFLILVACGRVAV